MPKAEAVDRILPAGARQLSEGYLGWLQAQGILTVRGDRIDLPGRAAEMTGEESALSKRILESFASSGLQPPAPKELCQGARRQAADLRRRSPVPATARDSDSASGGALDCHAGA